MKSDPLITYRRKPARLDTAQLEKFAGTLRDRVANRRSFHCRITGDAELRRLNRAFLGKDYPTDVLSFPAEPSPVGRSANPERLRHLGDLAISLGRARAQASRFGHDLETELRILMLHGVLHLLGMDHETDSGRMARAERKWLRVFRLPGGLIERARASRRT